MTLNRRNFLQVGMGIGIGATAGGLCRSGQAAQGDAAVNGADLHLSEYERILATGNHFVKLGHPRSWSVIQQGFLPISPERVLILEPKHLDGLANRWDWRDEQRRIRERMKKDADEALFIRSESGHYRYAFKNGISPEKLGLILWLTNELTRFYSAPEWWELWAYKMASREALGTTATGRCFAMPHQYQHHAKVYAATPIKTVNAGLDWWLVLIPGGTMHWEPLDDLPVHVMLTHLVAGPHSAGPGDQLRRWELCSRVERCFSWDSPNAFVELSRMDRVSAARLVNRHFVSACHDRP